MTLGSAPTGYRSGPLRCPECGACMSERPSDTASVDVCDDCGGVFVEWFDGEVSAALSGAAIPASPLAVRASGDGNCPSCRVPLSSMPYPDPSGVVVARCGQCAGTFVPRASFDAIVALGAPQGERVEEVGVIDSLLARLRALFDW